MIPIFAVLRSDPVAAYNVVATREMTAIERRFQEDRAAGADSVNGIGTCAKSNGKVSERRFML